MCLPLIANMCLYFVASKSLRLARKSKFAATLVQWYSYLTVADVRSALAATTMDKKKLKLGPKEITDAFVEMTSRQHDFAKILMDDVRFDRDAMWQTLFRAADMLDDGLLQALIARSDMWKHVYVYATSLYDGNVIKQPAFDRLQRICGTRFVVSDFLASMCVRGDTASLEGFLSARDFHVDAATMSAAIEVSTRAGFTPASDILMQHAVNMVYDIYMDVIPVVRPFPSLPKMDTDDNVDDGDDLLSFVIMPPFDLYNEKRKRQ